MTSPCSPSTRARVKKKKTSIVRRVRDGSRAEVRSGRKQDLEKEQRRLCVSLNLRASSDFFKVFWRKARGSSEDIGMDPQEGVSPPEGGPGEEREEERQEGEGDRQEDQQQQRQEEEQEEGGVKQDMESPSSENVPGKDGRSKAIGFAPVTIDDELDGDDLVIANPQLETQLSFAALSETERASFSSDEPDFGKASDRRPVGARSVSQFSIRAAVTGDVDLSWHDVSVVLPADPKLKRYNDKIILDKGERRRRLGWGWGGVG